MVSLRKYTKEYILNEVKHRFKKIASLLDDTDFDDQFRDALSWLDQSIFTPRAVLIKPEDFVEYNGGIFVDVSRMHIDVINNVYFADTNAQSFNTILPELGLLPFITNGSSLTQLGDISTYINIKTNINMMNRQLDLNGDYELFPIDEDGRQMLQLRTPNLTRLEFLPNLAYEQDYWYLYDNEYALLKNLTFAMCNLFNAEMQMSAQSLGVGKEANNLASYWEKKIEDIKEKFQDSVMINYMA